MDTLSNQVTAEGTYNNIPTSMTSNVSIVNLISGLTLEKSADKTNWVDGPLTYTIAIDNQTNVEYTNVTLTDAINTNLVDLLTDSIMINDVQAAPDQYTYTDGTLKITLPTVSANTKTTIRFSVQKKI